jgi:hypothetical protein
MIEEKSSNWFLLLLVGGSILVTAVSFFQFYIRKDYSFEVETSCDPTTEACFYRDCEGEGNFCPPNGLSYYKRYSINAGDFDSCTGGDCASVCVTGMIACIQIVCDDSSSAEGSVCVEPTPELLEENSTQLEAGEDIVNI